jgi:tetratricopeptide (TPR) repeat protein
MPRAALQLAEAFILAGELAEALDALNQHLAAIPDDDDVYRLRAAVLQRLPGDGHLTQALSDLDHLTHPTSADHLQRSIILESCGDHYGAVSAVEQARRLAPGDERLAERQLHLLLRQGELDAADQLLTEQPKTWCWQQWRGDVAALRGQHNDAIMLYTAALAELQNAFPAASRWADSLSGRLLLARAETCFEAGEFDRAEADYASAERLIPGEPIIAFRRGLLAALRGDSGLAQALCRAALDQAGTGLRPQMERLLRDDPRFPGLAEALLPKQ